MAAKTPNTRILIPKDLDSAQIINQANVAKKVTTIEGETMGTYWKLQLQLPVFKHIYAVERNLLAGLTTVNHQMSHWDADSELSKFNRAPAHTFVKLSKQFFAVLERALEIAELTQGAYSPVIGRLVQANGFGPPLNKNSQVESTSSRRSNSNWQQIILDPETQSASHAGDCQLDLSSIAKGFAVDLVCEDLEKNGITNYLFEIGGEFRGNGCKPDGQPWWVELDPLNDPQLLPAKTLIAACGISIATSGTSVQSRMSDGKMHHHLINPHTGAPTDHDLVAVSVVASTCTNADAWATALFILGERKGRQVAIEQNLAASFITTQGSAIIESFSPIYEALAAE